VSASYYFFKNLNFVKGVCVSCIWKTLISHGILVLLKSFDQVLLRALDLCTRNIYNIT
jgi:hypothetical protein